MAQDNLNKKLHSLAYFESIGMDENEFLTRIIHTFQNDFPLILNEINSHIENQNWRMIGSIAHKLKSSFMMLSLDHKKCLELEIEGKSESPNIEKIKNLSREVCLIMSTVISELNSYPKS